MDHFESIIATLLEAEHYWIRRSYKVMLSKEQKREIGKHSIPRPEIDLLALNFLKNEVVAFEVKSFLDSPGVRLSQLKEEHEIPEGRFKLFTSDRYRDIVFARIKEDLVECGMANVDTKLFLGLAAGKIYQHQSAAVRHFMQEKHFLFWSPEDIKQKVTSLAQRDYENDPAIITAKILMR